MSTPTPIISPQTAEQAVAAFEALALGADPAPPRQAAEQAVESLRGAALAAFLALGRHSADVLTQLQFEIEPFTKSEIADQVVALAAQAVTQHPALAAALRSAPILARIETGLSWGYGEAPERHARLRETLARLAAVYHQADAHDEPARLLAVAVPALDQRIAATVARHEAHAEADAARRQADAAAFEAQVQRGILKFTNQMRAWFDERPGQLFQVAEATLNGIQVGRKVLEPKNVFTLAVDPAQLTRAVAIRATCERGFRLPSRDEFHALGAETPAPAATPGLAMKMKKALGVA